VLNEYAEQRGPKRPLHALLMRCLH
jgi:hypothetical protein